MSDTVAVRLVSCPVAFMGVQLAHEEEATGVYLYYGPFPDNAAPRGCCQRCHTNGCAHVVAALAWGDEHLGSMPQSEPDSH